MRKKSLSISDIPLSKPRIYRPLSTLISPSNPNYQNPVSEIHHNPENPSVALRESEVFKIRKILPVKSKSQKKLIIVQPKEEMNHPPNPLDQLNSIEKCRKVFDKIIEKDKKYGAVLAKIKLVYENELLKKAKTNSESKMKLNLTALVKSEKPKIRLPARFGDLRKTEKKEVDDDRDSVYKETVSDLETIYTSGRGQVPELTLGNIERANFHEEFMSNFNNFSESWRKMANK